MDFLKNRKLPVKDFPSKQFDLNLHFPQGCPNYFLLHNLSRIPKENSKNELAEQPVEGLALEELKTNMEEEATD
ncbi:hypothetical protein PIB30_002041 [Stylosanthes scabra]|uniref:Uncharacterized protein n=1 Tax=Stylosanthes scabra TaxID=79078 RepID=A0ABU6Q2Q2_9FABA|nr:hypothetical protein [Stylosanthes scabra]